MHTHSEGSGAVTRKFRTADITELLICVCVLVGLLNLKQLEQGAAKQEVHKWLSSGLSKGRSLTQPRKRFMDKMYKVPSSKTPSTYRKHTKIWSLVRMLIIYTLSSYKSVSLKTQLASGMCWTNSTVCEQDVWTLSPSNVLGDTETGLPCGQTHDQRCYHLDKP